MKIGKPKSRRRLEPLLRKIPILILALVAVYNLTYVVTGALDKNLSFFGKTFHRIDTNSMEPVINKNDVVIFRKTNVANLEEGTIIIYLRNERLEVSRITAIRENRGITSYIIKGDNIYHIEEILGNNVQGEVVRIISNGIGLNILRAFGSKVITIIIAIYILLLVRYKRRRGHRLRS